MAAPKKSAVHVAFGAVLRLARRERGFTQETFARHVGLDRSYVGAIERGEFNVSFGTLMKLADGLDMRLSELLRRARL
jgi:transcriptional regulator with XRE-family HTH domain